VEEVTTCGALKNGKQYYIKSSDGRFAVLDTTKKLAFVEESNLREATLFTVVEKGCNVYGFCAGGTCMTRCHFYSNNRCNSDSGDTQTVKFHVDNADVGWSQWILKSSGSTAGGPYYLQPSDYNSYLTSKQTPAGDQLTLSTQISPASLFTFVDLEGPPYLREETKYYIVTVSGVVVLDANKKLGFATHLHESSDAAKFTAIHKGDNVFGICGFNGACMTRCHFYDNNRCFSDIGDEQTVKFHVNDSNDAWSQWKFVPLGADTHDGPFLLQSNDYFGFLRAKLTPNGDFQLTLDTVLDDNAKFVFHEVK